MVTPIGAVQTPATRVYFWPWPLDLGSRCWSSFWAGSSGQHRNSGSRSLMGQGIILVSRGCLYSAYGSTTPCLTLYQGYSWPFIMARTFFMCPGKGCTVNFDQNMVKPCTQDILQLFTSPWQSRISQWTELRSSHLAAVLSWDQDCIGTLTRQCKCSWSAMLGCKNSPVTLITVI